MPSAILFGLWLVCVGVLYGDSFDEEAWLGCDNAMFKSTYIYMLVSLQFYMLVSLQFYSCLQCVCVCCLWWFI